MTTYITVAIPYVNADPHLGYAFELVDADVAARARRVTPGEVIDRFGDDPLRWWLTGAPAAAADTDVDVERIAARSNADLANGIGNAVRRVTTLIDRHLAEGVPIKSAALPEARDLPARAAVLLAAFDRRGVVGLITDAVDALNREIEVTEPWKLAKQADGAGDLSRLLATYRSTLAAIVDAARLIVPSLAARADAHLGRAADRPVVQPRLDPKR